MSERKITLRVVDGELEHAVDHAILLLPGGVQVDAARNEIVAIGEPHELAGPDELARVLGKLLAEPPTDEAV